MRADPGATPVTKPAALPTVAIVVSELDQLPVSGVLENKVVPSTHAVDVPVIDAGTGLTVTIIVRRQPVAAMRYVTVATPAETPVTMPLVEPTVTADVEADHKPPVVGVLSVMLLPAQT